MPCFDGLARVVTMAGAIALGTACSELLGVDEWKVASASGTAGSGASGGAGGGNGAGGAGVDPPTLAWTSTVGGPGIDEPNDVGVSPAGLIAMTGQGEAGLVHPGGRAFVAEPGLGGWSVVFDEAGAFVLFHLLYGPGDQVFEAGTY
jgi:hypothetical protein